MRRFAGCTGRVAVEAQITTKSYPRPGFSAGLLVPYGQSRPSPRLKVGTLTDSRSRSSSCCWSNGPYRRAHCSTAWRSLKNDQNQTILGAGVEGTRGLAIPAQERQLPRSASKWCRHFQNFASRLVRMNPESRCPLCEMAIAPAPRLDYRRREWLIDLVADGVLALAICSSPRAHAPAGRSLL